MNRMKIILGRCFIAALMMAGCAACVVAQQNAGSHEPAANGVRPCWEDVERYCRGKRNIGPWAVQGCLAAHVKEISAMCHEHLIEENVKLPGDSPAPDKLLCQPDQKKFCPQTSLFEQTEAAYECLGQHLKDLSPGCQPQVQAARTRAVQLALDKVAQDCKDETALFCKGVEPKGFLLLDCLSDQKIKRAQACQAAVDAAKPYRKERKRKNKKTAPKS